MKCRLYLDPMGITLEVTPETDVEEIALRVWSDKFFCPPVKANGAYLLILTQSKDNQ